MTVSRSRAFDLSMLTRKEEELTDSKPKQIEIRDDEKLTGIVLLTIGKVGIVNEFGIHILLL